MQEIYIRDYPIHIGNTIQRILKSDYTLTGYYVDGELIWSLRIYGKTDKTCELLCIAVSEYRVYTELVDTDGGKPYYITTRVSAV